MRLCNNAVLAALLAAAALALPAQQAAKPATAPPASPQTTPAPSLTVDTDPVRSPDAVAPAPATGPMEKKGEGYLLHTDVEEVVLNATVLSGTQLVENLNKGRFHSLRRRGQADPASASSTPIFPSPSAW